MPIRSNKAAGRYATRGLALPPSFPSSAAVSTPPVAYLLSRSGPRRMAGSNCSESAPLHSRVAVRGWRICPHHSPVRHVSAVGIVVIRIRVVIHHRKPRAVVIVTALLHRLLAGLFVEGRRLARIRVPAAAGRQSHHRHHRQRHLRGLLHIISLTSE